MNLIELIIDENENMQGVEAISVVESPAIESDFVALKSEEVRLAEISKEKRILMGAVLIPENEKSNPGISPIGNWYLSGFPSLASLSINGPPG